MTELRPGIYDSTYTTHGSAEVLTDVLYITQDPESPDSHALWARNSDAKDGSLTSIYLKPLGSAAIRGGWVRTSIEGFAHTGAVTLFQVEGGSGDMYHGVWNTHGNDTMFGVWVLIARVGVEDAAD